MLVVLSTYRQRAVASKASSSVKAYIFGGLAFLPVPWAFATAAGLAMIALSASSTSPYMALAPSEVGLAAPAAATALLGKSGAVLLLIVLFLAVTSAVKSIILRLRATLADFIPNIQASAELVAVSSIITYDIYKRYFNPNATDKQILWVSHLGVIGFGISMMLLGVIFYEIGISISWLCGSGSILAF